MSNPFAGPIPPKLVRLWDHTWTETASGFVQWHNGFSVGLEHELAAPLRRLQTHDWTFTVYSTDELVWKVDKFTIKDERIRVICQPFLEVTRKSLLPDDYLVDLWLEAERTYHAATVDELQRLRAENERLREDAGMWTAVSNAFGKIRPLLEGQ